MLNRPATAPLTLLRWIGQAGLRLDEGLRRWQRVLEYCDDPRCMFRYQISTLPRDVMLADGTALKRGDRLINIHFWNEHVPEVPPEGPAIGWARTLAGRMDYSLRQLADFVRRNPELDDVVAIRAHAAVATLETESQYRRIMGHFGFQTLPDNRQVSWIERLHRYGENVLGLMFVLAVNPRTARLGILRRTRSESLISRKALDRRYESAAQ